MHVFRMFPLLLILLSSATFSSASWAAQRVYRIGTSVPEGRAVCRFSATITNASGQNAVLRIAPRNGEAEIHLISPQGTPLSSVSAGFQDGCDIFPNRPRRGTVRIVGDPARFVGLVPIHAHPGADCGAPTTAVGKVILKLEDPQPDQTLSLSPLGCDGDVKHGNLFPAIELPIRAVRGGRLTAKILLENLGPGPARKVTFRALIPAEWLLGGYSPRDRCRYLPGTNPTVQELERDRSDRSGTATTEPALACDLDDLHPDQFVLLNLELIPRTTGRLSLEFLTGAANSGGVAPDKLTRTTRVGQGSSAILAVTARSRNGGAGTVNINPAPSTGTSLDCTAPDPQNPATRDTLCIEIYDAPTSVTLTATATVGQFVGWTGDCSGNNATCVLQMDPNAAHPDKSAAARFRQ